MKAKNSSWEGTPFCPPCNPITQRIRKTPLRPDSYSFPLSSLSTRWSLGLVKFPNRRAPYFCHQLKKFSSAFKFPMGLLQKSNHSTRSLKKAHLPPACAKRAFRIVALDRRGTHFRSHRSRSNVLPKYASAQPVLSEVEGCPERGRRIDFSRVARLS